MVPLRGSCFGLRLRAWLFGSEGGSVALKIGPPEGFVFWTSASGFAVWFGRGVGLRASSFGLGVGVLDFGMCACINAKHLCMHMYTDLSGWGVVRFFYFGLLASLFCVVGAMGQGFVFLTGWCGVCTGHVIVLHKALVWHQELLKDSYINHWCGISDLYRNP